MTLRETLALFHRDGDPIELRFLGVERPGRVHAGWITLADADRVENKVSHLAKLSEGTYFTPQRLSPDVMVRGKPGDFPNVRKDGKGETTPRLTADADIERRVWLLIDVDPVRAPGFEKHSSTEGEKSAAWDVLTAIKDQLIRYGWGLPLVVDSGNGFHAYYPLPSPEPGGDVLDATADPVAVLLATLARRFDTPAAKVDAKVFNASRIMKLPGSWAKKGPNLADRPHRFSRVLMLPANWSVPE